MTNRSITIPLNMYGGESDQINLRVHSLGGAILTKCPATLELSSSGLFLPDVEDAI